mgnify:FL=1
MLGAPSSRLPAFHAHYPCEHEVSHSQLLPVLVFDFVELWEGLPRISQMILFKAELQSKFLRLSRSSPD